MSKVFAKKVFIDNVHIPDKKIGEDVINKLYLLLNEANVLKIKDFIKQNLNILNIRNLKNETPIHIVITNEYLSKDDKINLVSYLLLNGASAFNYDQNNITPLHLAVKHQIPELIELLVKYGADINSVDSGNRNALHYAIIGNNIECQPNNKIELFKNNMNDLNDENNENNDNNDNNIEQKIITNLINEIKNFIINWDKQKIYLKHTDILVENLSNYLSEPISIINNDINDKISKIIQSNTNLLQKKNELEKLENNKLDEINKLLLQNITNVSDEIKKIEPIEIIENKINFNTKNSLYSIYNYKKKQTIDHINKFIDYEFKNIFKTLFSNFENSINNILDFYNKTKTLCMHEPTKDIIYNNNVISIYKDYDKDVINCTKELYLLLTYLNIEFMILKKNLNSMSSILEKKYSVFFICKFALKDICISIFNIINIIANLNSIFNNNISNIKNIDKEIEDIKAPIALKNLKNSNKKILSELFILLDLYKNNTQQIFENFINFYVELADNILILHNIESNLSYFDNPEHGKFEDELFYNNIIYDNSNNPFSLENISFESYDPNIFKKNNKDNKDDKDNKEHKDDKIKYNHNFNDIINYIKLYISKFNDIIDYISILNYDFYQKDSNFNTNNEISIINHTPEILNDLYTFVNTLDVNIKKINDIIILKSIDNLHFDNKENLTDRYNILNLDNYYEIYINHYITLKNYYVINLTNYILDENNNSNIYIQNIIKYLSAYKYYYLGVLNITEDAFENADIKLLALLLNKIFISFLNSLIYNKSINIKNNLFGLKEIKHSYIESILYYNQNDNKTKQIMKDIINELDNENINEINNENIKKYTEIDLYDTNNNSNKIYKNENICYKINFDIIKLLIKNKINLNQKDNNNKIPIYYALELKNLDLIKSLTDNGYLDYYKNNKELINKIDTLLNSTISELVNNNSYSTFYNKIKDRLIKKLESKEEINTNILGSIDYTIPMYLTLLNNMLFFSLLNYNFGWSNDDMIELLNLYSSINNNYNNNENKNKIYGPIIYLIENNKNLGKIQDEHKIKLSKFIDNELINIKNKILNLENKKNNLIVNNADYSNKTKHNNLVLEQPIFTNSLIRKKQLNFEIGNTINQLDNLKNNNKEILEKIKNNIDVEIEYDIPQKIISNISNPKLDISTTSKLYDTIFYNIINNNKTNKNITNVKTYKLLWKKYSSNQDDHINYISNIHLILLSLFNNNKKNNIIHKAFNNFNNLVDIFLNNPNEFNNTNYVKFEVIKLINHTIKHTIITYLYITICRLIIKELKLIYPYDSDDKILNKLLLIFDKQIVNYLFEIFSIKIVKKTLNIYDTDSDIDISLTTDILFEELNNKIKTNLKKYITNSDITKTEIINNLNYTFKYYNIYLNIIINELYLFTNNFMYHLNGINTLIEIRNKFN